MHLTTLIFYVYLILAKHGLTWPNFTKLKYLNSISLILAKHG
jgi:hypothetical protein